MADGQQRLAGIHDARGYNLNATVFIAVADNNRGRQVVTGVQNSLTVELQQQIAGLNFIPLFDMGGKRYAVEFDGINADVDQ